MSEYQTYESMQPQRKATCFQYCQTDGMSSRLKALCNHPGNVGLHVLKVAYQNCRYKTQALCDHKGNRKLHALYLAEQRV